MRLGKDDFITYDTRIGDFTFKDGNGHHEIRVVTAGEFWRVVEIQGYRVGLVPSAARKLAKLMARAAVVVAEEEKRLRAWRRQGIAEERAAIRAEAVQP